MTRPPAGEDAIRLTVNGREVEVAVAPDTPLLYVLRNDLGLKGTRFGCGLGQCGACMVIVDGQAKSSCDLAVVDVRGRTVRTVEDLAREGRLDPLQQAFVDEGAGQCGFCLSGLLMAARALLDAEPGADDARFRSAFETNLCRCGVHHRVMRAVLRVAREGEPGA